ncbi:Alanine racemase [Candidatus Desulfarcum epimagneticum]|uniref:Alanine racemase n=1 Tax=uncultured Desulfobacteraceae bacterium TaxID=218296 RepID=A0A484HBA9_9BACT|nr:Alanine racemase [uncultured Desulfobacteraceae bacterium]
MNSHSVWAEIDLDAIASNVAELKRLVGPRTRLMAVAKADGYGHGAGETARTALENGADFIGVARLEEGAALRKAGISAPILIFGRTDPSLARDLARHGLVQTVFSRSGARALSGAAARLGLRIPAHIKVDTGMGRLGLLPDFEENAVSPESPAGVEWKGALGDIRSMAALEGLSIRGIYTHFASADQKDPGPALDQLHAFSRLLDQTARAEIPTGLRHAANSAAIIRFPRAHLDMARAGVAMYGLLPSPDMDPGQIRLKPAMSLKARVIHVKKVPAGFAASYGGTWRPPVPTTLATVSAGYADGVSRRLSNRGHMLVRGKRAPIAGRVCMDQTLLDAGHIPGIRVGDEAVIFGRQGEEEIGAGEAASAAGTIHYEIVSTVTARVPRVYVRGKKTGTGPKIGNRLDKMISGDY